MSNEIDLYQDLEIAEKGLELCKEKAKEKRVDIKFCKFWKDEIKNITKEIKEQYPDLVLGK